MTDKEILSVVEKTLDRAHPRQWYYALMDYGVHIKKTIGNVNIQSAHYVKQSPLEGSNRQVRGRVIKALVESHHLTLDELVEIVDRDPEWVKRVVIQLAKEGFLGINEKQEVTLNK